MERFLGGSFCFPLYGFVLCSSKISYAWKLDVKIIFQNSPNRLKYSTVNRFTLPDLLQTNYDIPHSSNTVLAFVDQDTAILSVESYHYKLSKFIQQYIAILKKRFIK